MSAQVEAQPAAGEAAAAGAAPAPEPAGARPVVCERFDDLGADGAPARLGVMGGTFDPVHIGHLVCAEQAREAFGLDGVVFMPAGVSVFKRDRRLAPADARLAMCRLAAADNPAFDVSALEIARGGDSYTVDTLRQLRAHYPENVELWFITGADAVLTLPTWHDAASLARLARFAAVMRPGYELPASAREGLAHAGFRVSYLQAPELEVSSSDVRRRLETGRSARYLVPPAVLRYIDEQGLYRA